MVGNTNSFLRRAIRTGLFCGKRSLPQYLAPTAAQQAQLAMGDALASCLIERRGFSSKDFAKFHPGGILGKRLYVKVNDLSKFNELPQIKESDSIKTAILEISGKCLGVTAVVENYKIVRAITDVYLIIMLERNETYDHLFAKDIVTRNPKQFIQCAAIEALDMKKKNIPPLCGEYQEQYIW